MHTKPHLLNARARGLHCVYVTLVYTHAKYYVLLVKFGWGGKAGVFGEEAHPPVDRTLVN